MATNASIQTFSIHCEHRYTAHVVNISAPSDLDALDRAYDLRGVVRAHVIGETTLPADVQVSIEDTQEQPLASVLAELQRLRDRREFGDVRRTDMSRRQAA